VTAAKKLRCSFCGRSEDQVKRLIAGEKALICDQCVVRAARTIQDAPDDTNPAQIGNKPVT
jgi:ATP-dependent Clp protease ATP-binding subunit ClpX